MEKYSIITYSIYLIVSIGLAVWVAHVLFKNATVFLREIFNRDEELSDSVGQLLKIGFYLCSLGIILFLLKIDVSISSYQELFEMTSFKLGSIVLILGGMHFFNVYVFFRLRRKKLEMSSDLDFQTHPHFGSSIKEQLGNDVNLDD